MSSILLQGKSLRPGWLHRAGSHEQGKLDTDSRYQLCCGCNVDLLWSVVHHLTNARVSLSVGVLRQRFCVPKSPWSKNIAKTWVLLFISRTGIARWNHICGPAKVRSVPNAAQVVFPLNGNLKSAVHIRTMLMRLWTTFPQSNPLTFRKQMKWKNTKDLYNRYYKQHKIIK